ncbi:MAG: family 20 glycosylhydrolase, partial [Desulfovibrionaceae bacterium]|nr:family 20 glycosylhydrolase [Desulfovibrionaceae bacterium]
MPDVSRHFFGVDEIKKLLDHMAKLKFNTFHWHLSDDQGFRIESLKFPQLNRVGSWRDEDGQKVGGYYTQEEIKQVVAYASERFINIVPEIDLPGHTGAIVATMPELSCSGEPHTVGFGTELNARILCAGSEKVYSFLYELLDEVCQLFPRPYFHVGGDEAPKSEWEKCPCCQQRIRDENLKDEEDLQAWFAGRLVDFFESWGKTVIGWNEILASGTVSPKAVAQYWIESGKEYSDKEADKGRKFVFSNMSAFYLDYPCALIGMRPIYDYDPYIIAGKSIPKDQVLGLEAPLWTERVIENSHVERLVFPRLLALAENSWTVEKDFAGFMSRAEIYGEYLQEQGIVATPIADCDPHGMEGARMAGIQIVEVLTGFTQAQKDKELRGKAMR